MATSTTKTNKPFSPRGNDQSPLAYNRAKLYSGKALDFDGVNDYVDLAGFTISGSVASFSFYVNADNTGNVYFLDANPNRFVLRFSNNNVALFSGSLVEFGAIKTNEWTHLVYVLNGTSAKCYANGVQLGTEQTITAIDLSAATDFDLGRWYLGGSYYDGGMSNFKIFNTALTAAQVADLYNNPEKVVPTGVDNTALKLWLPMMEGAGTTAYDGSGNGNHGTISGATYVNGIGAPVAQSAVMDWNKGTNLLNYSEDFAESSYWTPLQSTISANDTTAPDGQTTADKLLASATTGNHQVDGTFFSIVSGAVTSSVYAKKGNTNFVRLRHNSTTYQIRAWFDLENGVTGFVDHPGTSTIEDVGNGWYRCTLTEASNTKTGLASLQIFINESDNQTTWTADGDEYIYLWGASFEQSATAGPYIPTLSTAQTSEVLLPQGLTTGRDITGVNLFENVRKQGALNLDGNSWAEVHDNASLDVTTGLSLEGWVYVDVSKDIRGALIAKYKFTQSARAYSLELDDLTLKFILSYNGTNTTSTQGATTISTTGWYHFVGTYDGSNIKVYLNGAEDNTQAYSGGIYAQDYPVTIGVLDSDQQVTSIMDDQIAQPRIYNRALTASEVLNNYNVTKDLYI